MYQLSTSTSRRGMIVLLAVLVIAALGLAQPAVADGGSGSSPDSVNAPAATAFPKQYVVPKSTMTKNYNRCRAHFKKGDRDRKHCFRVQKRRKWQTDVIITRRRIMRARKHMDFGLWYLLARPIIADDKAELKKADEYLQKWNAHLCSRFGCRHPSHTHWVTGWDWFGGSYVGVLLSRKLTVHWANKFAVMTGAATAAGSLCGSIPKATWVGVAATATCAGVVAWHFGEVSSSFHSAKKKKTRCVELRFHTLYDIALAKVSKVVNCR